MILFVQLFSILQMISEDETHLIKIYFHHHFLHHRSQFILKNEGQYSFFEI
jgi:hypothetical protein